MSKTSGSQSTAPETPPTEKKRRRVDWEAIERDYRAGVKPLRQIADETGVSPAGILKKAKRLEWSRDLNAKIQAKAEELVNNAVVNESGKQLDVFTEKQVVFENAAQTAQVRLSQRRDISRLRTIITAQMEELEASSGPEQASLLRELGDRMREEDDSGRDRLNDVYRAVISLPERSKVAKQLAETLRIAIDLERREFGMDKIAAADDPLTAMLKRINAASGSAFKPVAVDPAYSGEDDE